MRVAVTGAAGLVGRALAAKYQAIPLTHSDLDITDRAAVRRKMTDLRPDLIINCAVVGVDACEDDPKLAKAVNVDGPRNLAEAVPAGLGTEIVSDCADRVDIGLRIARRGAAPAVSSGRNPCARRWG